MTERTKGLWRAGRPDSISVEGGTGEAYKNIYADDPRAGMHMGRQLPLTVARAVSDGVISDDEIFANAEFIVRACNSHDELVDALEHAEAVLSIVEPRTSKAEYLETLALVRAALSKASAGPIKGRMGE